MKELRCPKCNGEGWVWSHELDDYYPPDNFDGIDDTRYTCDSCKGKGFLLSDEQLNPILKPKR